MQTQKQIIASFNRKAKAINKRLDDLHIVDSKSGRVVTDIYSTSKTTEGYASKKDYEESEGISI